MCSYTEGMEEAEFRVGDVVRLIRSAVAFERVPPECGNIFPYVLVPVGVEGVVKMIEGWPERRSLTF